MNQHDDIDLSKVDWWSALPRLGLDTLYLENPGKSRPCPLHPVEKSTKFRFMRPFDRGVSVCNDCGVMNPAKLALSLNGWHDDKTGWHKLFAVLRGTGAIGSISQRAIDTPERAVERANLRKRGFEKMRKWWRATKSLGAGESAAKAYIERRVPLIDVHSLGHDMRAHPGLAYFEEGDHGKSVRLQFPALIALFRDVNGDVQYMHRIYVTPKGEKAAVACPRKMYVPGEWVKGCAVRIGRPEQSESRVIGVSEGVEKSCAIYTACAGKFPVWAAGSADAMAALEIPEFVEVVHIFADHNLPTPMREDGSQAHPLGHSQEAAERLRVRIEQAGKKAIVRVAATVGGDHEDDWKAMNATTRVPVTTA